MADLDQSYQTQSGRTQKLLEGEFILQYEHLLTEDCRGANPNFHEVVEDLLSPLVSTSRHLKQIGLLRNSGGDSHSNINLFYCSVVTKCVYLPFAYTMDKYRRSLF
ncbi:hypothetical protein RP20_CCG007566 [Aedes albopictus]|nr:hypothetical protein RP20_CCG007566 [Aedes albopictus]